MQCWRALPALLEHEDVVLVTVARTQGSAPREAGTTMLVTLTRTADTIGGGHLEWEAMAQARAMLLQADATPALQRFSLGASLGQCCGGVVWLAFERVERGAREAWIERVALLGSSAVTRRLSGGDGESRWAVCEAGDSGVRPRAVLSSSATTPSPGPDGPPSPASGRGDGYAGARCDHPAPECSGRATDALGAEHASPDACEQTDHTAQQAPRDCTPLSRSRREAGVSDGEPSACAADWLCRASRAARSGVAGQGQVRDGQPANSTRPSSHNTKELATAWTFTETLTPPSFNLTVFGAGHVGAAVVRILATLDARIRWVDVRDDLFSDAPLQVQCIATDTPEAEVASAPASSFFLVLTHSHALDLQLAEHILRDNRFAWFGLIGSRTKRARFTHRLLARGIAPEQLARMTCPIGVPGIRDKQPEAIAIAVAAQLLQAREAAVGKTSLAKEAHA